ncbi:hypothetical protein [Nocardioides sp. SYSU DS0663]|uniref:hypothetical protein n=1 Tax=Nocardioides sp. SYSU DS0663 TaxID=3416445 RepID=UPI003F4C1F98
MTTPHDGNHGVPVTGRHEDAGAHPTAVHETQHDTHHGRHDGDFAAHRDRVRWGPLWAGVLVTIASFLVMQLAIFAADLFGSQGDAGTWLTAAAALIAFFLGGLVAGATALWHSVSDGLFNGIILWAFATVGLVLLALLGGGALLGPISTVASDLVQVQEANLDNVSSDQVSQALDSARTAAGWSLLGLLLALLSSAAGGAVGAKIWPGRDTARTSASDARGVVR